MPRRASANDVWAVILKLRRRRRICKDLEAGPQRSKQSVPIGFLLYREQFMDTCQQALGLDQTLIYTINALLETGYPSLSTEHPEPHVTSGAWTRAHRCMVFIALMDLRSILSNHSNRIHDMPRFVIKLSTQVRGVVECVAHGSLLLLLPYASILDA